MNIFVAKLSFDTTSESLKAAFERFGEVSSAQVIMDKESGRSRGFAFVEMNNNEEALAAISALDNTEFEGKVIAIQEARGKDKK